MNDLTTFFRPGQTVFVKAKDVWAPIRREVKSVTAKQIRFVDKSHPAYVNEDRFEGMVHEDLKAFYQHACTNTEQEIAECRAKAVALAARLLELQQLRDAQV